MNTKKDEPGKGTAGASGSAGARPHATLDLKATEVGSKSGKDQPMPAGQVGAQDPSQNPGKGPGTDKAPAGSAEAAKGTGAAAGAAKPDPKAAGDGAKPGVAPKPAPARPAGFGGIFTHLAAGILGGIFALLAADMLAGQLGLGGAADDEVAQNVQQRLAALETARKQGTSSAELVARLKGTETRLDELEPLAGRVDGLAEEQSTLARNVTGIGEKLGAEGVDADVPARIAKLEEQLSTLSAAAASNPDGNGLPQLAALTGKLADLEQTVNQQLDAVRKSVNDELDSRLSAASEASEAARSGTRRMDREVATLKAETAQIDTRINSIGAQSDSANTTLARLQDEISKLKVEVGSRIAQLAKPEDVAAAVSPVDAKITALQQKVEGVVQGEGDRQATAERIVLSLELANLKRAIDRGSGYAPELAQAQKLAGDSIDLTPLARFESTGVPTLAELRKEFKSVAFNIIDAEQQPADGSIVDRLLAGAKSVVRVRKISHSADDKTVEAVVARMETALAEDQLDAVLAEAETLPPPAQAAAQDFLAKVKARNAVDKALTQVEAKLKSSLMSPAGGNDAAKE
jgi:hypothetical protein